jgi:hypothetical protein
LINNNDAVTNSRVVRLVLRGGPDTVRMAISNTADFSFASQESYQTEKTWALSGGDELKTVYARFYNQCGYSSDPVSDSIVFGESLAPTPFPGAEPVQIPGQPGKLATPPSAAAPVSTGSGSESPSAGTSAVSEENPPLFDIKISPGPSESKNSKIFMVAGVVIFLAVTAVVIGFYILRRRKKINGETR